MRRWPLYDVRVSSVEMTVASMPHKLTDSTSVVPTLTVLRLTVE